MPPLDPLIELAAQWQAYAEVDLRIVRLCAADAEMPLWPIGFHSQQAVEKCLKAALVLQGITPDRIHRLADLARDLRAVDLQAPLTTEELLLLTPFGVDEKYPRVRPGTVAPGDAAVLIDMAERAIGWLQGLLAAAMEQRRE